MKKLRLDIEVLRVQSFTIHGTESRGGTVRGHAPEGYPSQMIGCDPYAPTSTGCSTAPPASEVGPSCYPGCTLIEH